MRVCNICEVEKDETEYSRYTTHPKSGPRHHLMRRCRDCQRLKIQEYRKKDSVSYNQQSTDRHLQAKLKAINYKGGKCTDCHGSYPPCVYDFHHLDPTKKDIVPSGALRRRFETAKAELDKCVLLCANCHRIRHYETSIS